MRIDITSWGTPASPGDEWGLQVLRTVREPERFSLLDRVLIHTCSDYRAQILRDGIEVVWDRTLRAKRWFVVKLVLNSTNCAYDPYVMFDSVVIEDVSWEHLKSVAAGFGLLDAGTIHIDWVVNE